MEGKVQQGARGLQWQQQPAAEGKVLVEERVAEGWPRWGRAGQWG